ncbi:MAG: recombinase family protein [Candidatus Omnitrophica bacterium]|nr:recombinase family protein [Candidatus Omnitrophota bacterium]
MSKKYCIYLRVSTDEQARFGYSLESMLDKCKHYIASQDDAVLVEVYEDNSSGTLSPSKRPALCRLMGEVSSGKWDVILVWKLDRLSRSLRDTLEIEHVLRKANKGLESVTERLDTSTAAGRMFFNTVASFAEFESAQIADRTRTTMSVLASNGKHHLGGKPPLGYKLGFDGAYVVNESCAEVVRVAFEQFLRLKCFSKVARVLNERGLLTANGKRWSHRQIMLLIKNPAYVGRRVWGRVNQRLGRQNPAEKWVVSTESHAPLVSERVFDRAQQLCEPKG